jgi:transposase
MKITTQNLDHLGLVAGMCKEIGVAKIVDSVCGPQAKNKHLTYGQCVEAMILNGLGFVGRTLYLYSEYFEDKPVDLLIGAPVKPEHVDDNALGRTLDKLFEIGVSELYTKIALQAMTSLGIEVKSLHIDSTSFHVDGEYQSLLEQGEARIQLVPGYSRDHRPELNQAVLQLVTSNQGGLPLFMQAASGNSSDKTAFSEIVKQHIKSFENAVKNRYFVGDSALYTPDSLKALADAGSLFVTRVPAQINAAKECIQETDRGEMHCLGNGYYSKEYERIYAGVRQRWVVFFSQAAYERERLTLEKRCLKEFDKESKSFGKLAQSVFFCREDALKHLEKFISKLKYTDVEGSGITEVQKHPTVGRPRKGSFPETVGYQVTGRPVISARKKADWESSKGFFVLATNDLDGSKFTPDQILATYKSQQNVERGFRFLKSPDFLVSSFFLKKPERIEALLMVMTLCLLVYAALEYKARQKLRETGEHFLDQKKRPSQNPTARWIFFCFLGLHVVNINGKRRQVTNLKPRHEIILMCLGPPYQKFYHSDMW